MESEVMRYAIIADIHGNLEALQVVLGDTKNQECTHFACLGDVVGYNANPKECLDMIRGMGMPCVKGNHDEYCSSETGLEGFNPHAAEAVNWTRHQLTEDDRHWLRDLKYLRLVASFSIVHATLDGPQRWGYVFDKLAAAASFTYQNPSVCFFGHTHVPVAFVAQDAGIRVGSSPTRIHARRNGEISEPAPREPVIRQDDDVDIGPHGLDEATE
jgi:predicted phosphodiesterase